MDQVRNGRESAALTRRLLRRTLTVAGGAAAGTAIAWFLATGTAAAESPADLLDDPTPVLSKAVTPLGGTLDVLAAGLAERPSTPLDQVGDQLTRAADHVDVLPDGGLTEVVEAVGSIESIETSESIETVATVAFPVQVTGLAPTRPGPRPAAAPAGTVTDAGVAPEHTAARTATERAYATGMPHRGSPEPATPDTPTWPAPFTPTVPAPGHTGHTGANPADSPLSAALPWPAHAPRPVRGLTAPAAEATFSGRAGDQPGIAPD